MSRRTRRPGHKLDAALSASYLAENQQWALALDMTCASTVDQLEANEGRRLTPAELEAVHNIVSKRLERHKPTSPADVIDEWRPTAPDHLDLEGDREWHATQRMRVGLHYAPEVIKAAGLSAWWTENPPLPAALLSRVT